MKAIVKEASDIIKKAPPIKLGKANRPRALTTAQEKID